MTVGRHVPGLPAGSEARKKIKAPWCACQTHRPRSGREGRNEVGAAQAAWGPYCAADCHHDVYGGQARTWAARRPDLYDLSRRTHTRWAPPPLGSAQCPPPPVPLQADSAAIHAEYPGSRWSRGLLKYYAGTVETVASLNFRCVELGARRECEPSVPCRSRCGSADGLALAPALHLCNHAHSRIALQVQPTQWAHPPHAPVSARCHCTPFAREDSIHETYACRQDAGQLRVATTGTRA